MATESRLSIEGMTCDHCVGRVTETLKKLPGVIDVSVSLEAKSATVRFDESALTTAAIVGAVVEAGYGALANEDTDDEEEPAPPPGSKPAGAVPPEIMPSEKTVRFNISGMTCANCASTIEKGVGALEGHVARLHFNTSGG